MMTEPILCPECGHDIDEHRPVGCMHVAADTFSMYDDCTLSAAEIARAHGEKRFDEGWAAHELRWAVGHSE